MKIKNMRLLATLMDYVQGLEIIADHKIFNMGSFQSDTLDGGLYTTKESVIKSCSTTCCAAGWVALCPAFKQQGVEINAMGQPTIEGMNIIDSLRKLFGLNRTQVSNIFYDYNIMTPKQSAKRVREVMAGKYRTKDVGCLR